MVQLTTPQIFELDKNGSVVVDIDGMNVGFEIDGRETELPECDYQLGMGGDFSIGRLYSGFPMRYYNVLDGRDLSITYEHRLDGEDLMQQWAGGFVSLDDLVEMTEDIYASEFDPTEVPDEDDTDETVGDYVGE